MVFRFGGWWGERVKGNEKRIQTASSFVDACANYALKAMYPISASLVDLSVACVPVPGHVRSGFGKWTASLSEDGSYVNFKRELRGTLRTDEVRGYLRELDSEGFSLVNVHPEIWRYPEMFVNKVNPLSTNLGARGRLSGGYRKELLAEALAPFASKGGADRLAANVSLKHQEDFRYPSAEGDMNTQFSIRSDRGRISLGDIAVTIPVHTRVSYAVLDDIGVVDKSIVGAAGGTCFIDSGKIISPALAKNGVESVRIETLIDRLRFVLPTDFTLGFDNMANGLEAVRMVEDSAIKVLKNTTSL